jgi:hypothetical protein
MALLYTGFFYFSLLEPSLVGVRDFFHICAVVELAIHPKYSLAKFGNTRDM